MILLIFMLLLLQYMHILLREKIGCSRTYSLGWVALRCKGWLVAVPPFRNFEGVHVDVGTPPRAVMFRNSGGVGTPARAVVLREFTYFT
jgi:hypothetical protein